MYPSIPQTLGKTDLIPVKEKIFKEITSDSENEVHRNLAQHETQNEIEGKKNTLCTFCIANDSDGGNGDGINSGSGSRDRMKKKKMYGKGTMIDSQRNSRGGHTIQQNMQIQNSTHLKAIE